MDEFCSARFGSIRACSAMDLLGSVQLSSVRPRFFFAGAFARVMKVYSVGVPLRRCVAPRSHAAMLFSPCGWAAAECAFERHVETRQARVANGSGYLCGG